ncbi:IS30 family transposase [Flavobacterium magnum]|uniref:IS30 family transposase n=1 Tax=Flavobacterium magnum TaxID=2162713 RepID=A0A2S0RHL0_9FLAO|nr:IS30 family transposase [Flavobacterium magnum]AWA31146.1 IS30 family transposase [Flavobacterium magnum]
MKTKFTRLNLAERIQIEKLFDKGLSASAIAVLLGRHKSTITRELKKTHYKTYLAINAHIRSVKICSAKNYGRSKISGNKKLYDYVVKHLRKRWSPEQISLSLKKKFPNQKHMQTSHETIYYFVYLHSKKSLKEELIKQLRQQRKTRGSRHTKAVRDVKIPDRTSIDERPEEVKGRQIPGHWEGDLIVGKEHGSYIGTLVERSSRYVILVHLQNKEAATVRKAFEQELAKLPKIMRKSLTYDNETEMAQHKLLTKTTKMKVYFTHPYSPWERPTNENTNGLLRDYFPKGTDLSVHSKAHLKKVQKELNERPRKVLDVRSPVEVFKELILDKIPL